MNTRSVLAFIAAACVSASIATAQETATTKPAADLSQYILTPKPGPEPRINGPKTYGQRPGRTFLYTIPATGDRPITFAADNLPDGLKLDAKTGRITGRLEKAGEYATTLRAANA